MTKERGERNMNKKLSSLSAVMLILSVFIAFLPAFALLDAPSISIINPDTEDSDFIFDTNTAYVGYQFTAEIWVNVTEDIDTWQTNVQFDPEYIECVSVSLPSDHIFEGRTVVQPDPTIKNVSGYVIWGSTIMSGAPFAGVGKEFQMTFEIMKEPPRLGTLSCDITFDFVSEFPTYFVDTAGGKIIPTPMDGYYEFSWAEPTTRPYLEVVPSSKAVGGAAPIDIVPIEFVLSVYLKNLDANWQLIAYQFFLTFNDTLLELTDVEEGPFLTDPSWAAYGTMFLVYSDPGDPWAKWSIGGIINANPDNEWLPPFPEGEGVVVKLHFKVIHQEMFPWEDTTPIDISPMFDECSIDSEGNYIPYEGPNDGSVTVTGYVTGRTIDLYTQYPSPYGGQGARRPSDMFWPQKEVILSANVSYNLWPEQNKDVAFQIIDPHGETWGIYHNRTNDVGVACVFVRLPWTCDDPEYYLGEWTVIASVDVACETVTDELTFHYDYLIHLSIETDKDSYKHCEDIVVTVHYKSKAMQSYDVVIVVTVADETGVPFGFVYTEVTIGGAEYCHYEEFKTELRVLHVVKFARAGIADIYYGGLTDFPFAGGCPISPTYVSVKINILAEWVE